MAKVNIIYHHFPHYRAPILRELARSKVHEYHFWGSLDDIEGIRAFGGDELVSINPIKFSFLFGGKIWHLHGFWRAIFDKDAKVIIVHAPPNMPASWMIAMTARLLNKKVIYWVHGWLKPEPKFKSWFRRSHYNLGNRILTYADRAIEVATHEGFNPHKITPIYNSLDWRKAEKILEKLGFEGEENVRKRLKIDKDVFRLICVSRLTAKCRFDVLLDAMSLMKEKSANIELCLIGDGPEKENLKSQAEKLDVSVKFLGEMYEEEKVGEQLFSSSLTVSPGKIGLSAIHSLMYGTPVVSHSDLNEQMPEVEAIIPNITGDLFIRDSAQDLARVILNWLQHGKDRSKVREECLKIIEEKYNPVVQAQKIDNAVTKELS